MQDMLRTALHIWSVATIPMSEGGDETVPAQASWVHTLTVVKPPSSTRRWRVLTRRAADLTVSMLIAGLVCFTLYGVYARGTPDYGAAARSFNIGVDHYHYVQDISPHEVAADWEKIGTASWPDGDILARPGDRVWVVMETPAGSGCYREYFHQGHP